MLHAAPGEADKEACQAAHKQDCAHPVHLPQLLSERNGRGATRADEHARGDEADDAEREVDVKAPAPRCPLDESPAHHRTDDAADRPRAKDDGEVLGALSQRNEVGEDDLCEGNDAPTAQPLHTAPDEHDGDVVREGAEDGAESKGDNGRDEKLLATQVLRDRRNHWLADGRHEQIRRADPECLCC